MTERDTILKLRADALRRGMYELGLAYGWSAIRMGGEILDQPTNPLVEGAILLRKLYDNRTARSRDR